MCSGDRNGIISPYFFESIQDTQTGALIDFYRPPAPLRQNMLRPVVKDEVDLPPPWGVTGFEPIVGLENKSIHFVRDGRHIKNERSLLQASFQGIYNQIDTSFIEKDLIGLAVI